MATAADFRRIALAFAGVAEAPHFERTAFKARIIFASLAKDGTSANLKLTPEQQMLKCEVAPDVFQPVTNAWGKQGWTVVELKAATMADLKAALQLAWQNGS